MNKHVVLGGALVVGACGGGPLPDRHIRGTLEVDTRAAARVVTPVRPPPSEIRIGLAWYGEPSADPARRQWVLQEVPIVDRSDTWPMEFEVALTEPPPPGAIHYELGYAQAKFVAYRDNGSGSLDWTPIAADAFIDTVAGFHPQLYLWSYDDGGLKLMMPGASELSAPDTPISLLERTDDRSSCHLLEATPRFSFEAQRFSYADPDEGEQGPWDHQMFARCPTHVPPPGATVSCEADPVGQSVYYASWPVSGSAAMNELCGPLMQYCEGRREDPGTPGPWPCPCDPTLYTCVPGGNLTI